MNLDLNALNTLHAKALAAELHLGKFRLALEGVIALLPPPAAGAPAAAEVVVKGQRWHRQSTSELIEELCKSEKPLAAAFAALRLASEKPGQWFTATDIHKRSGNADPIQSRNELGALSKYIELIRPGAGRVWPIEARAGRITRYLSHPLMSEWLREALDANGAP